MSTLFVDTITEKTSGNGVAIAGHVVQVVHSADATTDVNITSASFTHTGLTAQITPQYSNSKILVIVSQQARQLISGTGSMTSDIRLYRDGSAVTGTNQRRLERSGWNGYVTTFAGFVYEDSPNTTSQVEYKTFAKNATGDAVKFQHDDTDGRMTLLEIAQ